MITQALTSTPGTENGRPIAIVRIVDITAIDFFKGDENTPKEPCKDPKKPQSEAKLIEG